MKNIKLFQQLASLKLTTIVLCFLAILTFFGTLYQAEYGLYAAQQKFFYSWLFRWYVGIPWTEYRIWFPFPGGALVLFVFTINLIFGLWIKFKWSWKNTGLALSHLGLLVLLIGGAWTHYIATETAMTLSEGEEKSYGESSQHWELAIWKNTPDSAKVFARNIESMPRASAFDFGNGQLPFQIKVDSSFVNSIAYGAQPGIPDFHFVSPSEIAMISGANSDKEPANNKPGIVFEVSGAGQAQTVLLHAFDMEPAVLRIGKDLYSFQIRRQRVHMPFSLKLVDFRRELHGGTGMAKKYESLVSIHEDGKRSSEALIAMNQPLRKAGYIFYQASFAQGDGAEQSTFSVVQNDGRVIPYIASLMMGLGLLIHFLMRMKMNRKEKKNRV